MKWRIFALIVFLSLLLPYDVAAQSSEDDTLVVPAGETYEGDLATTTRSVRVDGVVTGDVTTWSGNIEINGTVMGDVVSYSGNVTIANTAQVHGHVMALGAGLELDPNAAIGGQLIRGGEGSAALANIFDIFSPSTVNANDSAIGRVLIGLVMGVFLLACCVLSIAFWPHRTARSALMLRNRTAQATGFGLLTTVVLAVSMLPLGTLLVASLIGMPILLVLALALQLPYVLGMATLARSFGVVVGQELVAPERKTLIVAGGLALLVAVCVMIMPLAGLALFYLVASPGLGAVLLSRGGLLGSDALWNAAPGK
jgi:hypothetical protein